MPVSAEAGIKGYEVMIATVTGSLSVIGLLGETPARITDGVGGWEVVERPRRAALTHYKGRSPFQMQINLMFDGWLNEESQELKLKKLTWMGLPPKKGKDPDPVRLYGALPFPSGGDWIINDLDYGNNVIWAAVEQDKPPVRLRQDVTVTLLEHISADRVELLRSNIGLKPAHPAVYTVKKGDTLKSLAAKFYGDYKLWHKIAKANNIRDPSKVKVGQVLRIPD